MAVNGAITKLSDVKHWFFLNRLPYWTLYTGRQERDAGNTKSITARNVEIEDMDESWDMLEGLLSKFSAGIFTVLVKPKADHTGLAKITYSPESKESQSNQLLGQPQIGSLPTQALDQIIEEKHKIWGLERQVEDLTAAMNAKQPIGEKIFALLENNFEHILNTIVPLLTKGTPSVGQISGIPDTSNRDEIINDALIRIQAHFELADVLPKLAVFVEKNPDMAKQLLNNL